MCKRVRVLELGGNANLHKDLAWNNCGAANGSSQRVNDGQALAKNIKQKKDWRVSFWRSTTMPHTPSLPLFLRLSALYFWPSQSTMTGIELLSSLLSGHQSPASRVHVVRRSNAWQVPPASFWTPDLRGCLAAVLPHQTALQGSRFLHRWCPGCLGLWRPRMWMRSGIWSLLCWALADRFLLGSR